MPKKDPLPPFNPALFWKSLGNACDLLQLFEFLPDVYLYVKDRHGRYLRANHVVCRVVGVDSEERVIGRTDFDFFPPAIAAQYVDEDRRVIRSGKPLADQIWLVPDAKGVPQIYLCNKIPLLDSRQVVIGIAGLKRPYRNVLGLSSRHGRLMRVVEYVTQNYGDPLTVAELAEEADLSVSQLHREFGAAFGITPGNYVREVRIGVARHMLETSDLSMAEIAQECGFYDQSHFSKQFKVSTGLTPLQYKRQFGQHV